MTPAMRADAADALLRIELKELGAKLIALGNDENEKHVDLRVRRLIDRYVPRFELMAKEIETQSAEAKASTNGQ